MSDTPRTDKVNTEIQGGKSFPFWSAVIIDHARTLERELAAMTAEKELAERQVAVLANMGRMLCSQAECAKYDQCSDCKIAWSRAEAARGVQG